MSNYNLKIDGQEHHTLLRTLTDWYCVATPFKGHCDWPIAKCSFRASTELKLEEASRRWIDWHNAEHGLPGHTVV